MASISALGVLQSVAVRSIGAMKHVRNVYKKVGVIGVPFDKGQTNSGVALAPDELRRAGVIESMKAVGKYKILTVKWEKWK
ncbi:Arginase [Gryllus bimaculatus]|nr:Arginase [Gryllus bimaculatus]